MTSETALHRHATIKMDMDKVLTLFRESVNVKRDLLEGDQLSVLVTMAHEVADRIRAGKKLMICGNGGSAADAQHLAAELLVRLRPMNNRPALPAIALAMDTSTITACGNDFGFEHLYERMVQGLGSEGDVLLAISTSGNSPNVLRGLSAARQRGIRTLGFLGRTGGNALPLCDLAFLVPSLDTGRVQEVHITAGHAMMELIEDQLLASGDISLVRR